MLLSVVSTIYQNIVIFYPLKKIMCFQLNVFLDNLIIYFNLAVKCLISICSSSFLLKNLSVATNLHCIKFIALLLNHKTLYLEII